MSTVEQIRLTQYERFSANRRFEEITDIAERVGFAIDTTISYEQRDGYLYALSDTKQRPFHEQTALAKANGRYAFQGSEAFEYTRLCHEHEEALMADALSRGELDGNVMIKLSRVPDAVASGSTDISGYRRDLLRSFVRIYYAQDSFIKCRLFSLDGNNNQGIDKVGELIGIDTCGKSSEEILGQSRILNVQDDVDIFVDTLCGTIKKDYDLATLESTGASTHAGSLMESYTDAHSIVASHANLINEHMQAIADIQARVLDDTRLESLLESQRRLTSAAIKLSVNGMMVGSTSDGAVALEADNGNYGRECATVNGMNQAENELLQDWVKQVSACPLCGRKNVTAVKKGEVISSPDCGCALNVCTGEKTIGTNLDTNQNSMSPEKPKNTPNKPNMLSKKEMITRKYGEYACVRTEIAIFTSYEIVYDRRNGQVLDKY